MPIDALSILCAQLTRDLLAIAKFLFVLITINKPNFILLDLFHTVEQHTKLELYKQEHPEGANLYRCQTLNWKWTGIWIQIFGLTQIQMSAGCVPKCFGCIILSALVIWPSIVQIGHWLC